MSARLLLASTGMPSTQLQLLIPDTGVISAYGQPTKNLVLTLIFRSSQKSVTKAYLNWYKNAKIKLCQ